MRCKGPSHVLLLTPNRCLHLFCHQGSTRCSSSLSARCTRHGLLRHFAQRCQSRFSVQPQGSCSPQAHSQRCGAAALASRVRSTVLSQRTFSRQVVAAFILGLPSMALTARISSLVGFSRGASLSPLVASVSEHRQSSWAHFQLVRICLTWLGHTVTCYPNPISSL
jgi:hypothetical protein